MKYVYFIKPVDMDGPIKIGCSGSPDGRARSLETWSPFALEVIARIDGSEKLERRFHAHFERFHQRREWFHPAPEIYEVVAQINAGTFDIGVLPDPKRIDGQGIKRPDYFPKLMSYALRITHAERRSGRFCPVHTRNAVKYNDIEAIAKMDAFLADPEVHGQISRPRWSPEEWAR